MHPEDIKAALRKRGRTMTSVARDCGVSRVTVHYVVQGKGTSRRVAQRICEITELPAEILWPGRYPALASAWREGDRRRAERRAA